MILRCTAKLLKLLGENPPRETGTSEEPAWEEWYANLIPHRRHRHLLLTHGQSLFSIFVPRVKKADLLPVHRFLAVQIGRALEAEGLPPDAFGSLTQPEVPVRRTRNRRVVGSMVDQAFHCEIVLEDSPGGLDPAALEELNHRLRRGFHAMIGPMHPIEVVQAKVQGLSQREWLLEHRPWMAHRAIKES